MSTRLSNKMQNNEPAAAIIENVINEKENNTDGVNNQSSGVTGTIQSSLTKKKKSKMKKIEFV